MKNLIITIEHLVPGADPAQKDGYYPVRLYCDDAGPGWLTAPLAESKIPENLSVPSPPTDPVSRLPLDGGQIRELFLEPTTIPRRLEAMGQYMYQLLFQGDVATEWDRLRGLYPRETQGDSEGRRVLLDIKDPGLGLLPWELLQTPALLLPLFFDSRNPISRGTLDPVLPREYFPWPIHALIVVGSAENDPAVKAEDEIRDIQRAFIKSKRPIDWEVMWRPTKEDLTGEIAQFKPQIFHFIGHGRSVPGQPDPVLELSDKKGVAPHEEWSVTDIAIGLVAWQPRFAFINACRSSNAQVQEAVWTITTAFAQAGVPAVLGMQSDVQGQAAAVFAGKLYASFGGGAPLDQAVAEARAAVTANGRDWALPTLRLSVPPEHVLPMQPDIDAQRIKRFESDSKLKSINDFVDRKPLRRSIWYGVDPTPLHDEEQNMLIVRGVETVGKTSLVKAGLKMCALRQRQVAYVDIDNGETKNFLGVLNAIRQGEPDSGSLICPRLPDTAMADFDAAYGALMEQPGADVQVAGDPVLLEKLFASFREALARVAAAAPLIIALDHMNIEQSHSTGYLVPHLFLPVARGEVEGVRMILVGTPTELNRLLADKTGKTDNLMNNALTIDVSLWHPNEFEPLAQEFCLYNDVSLDGPVKMVIKGFSQMTVNEWSPSTLPELRKLIKAMRGQ